MRTDRQRLALLAALGLAIVACSPGPSLTPGPPTSGPPTVAPSDAAGSATFPPEETAVEAGTYRWDGFEPAIEIDVEAGWAVGHRHPEFVDLWDGIDFPAIGFGRFPHVHGAGSEPVETTDAETVVLALGANDALDVEVVGPVELAGLIGQAIEIVPKAAQTPVWEAPFGGFHLDPGFDSRWNVLDLPGGGVLLVWVITEQGDLEQGLDRAAPMLASLRIAG